MRETSLDEFLDRDDGGADGGSEGEGDDTRRGAEVESAVEPGESEADPGESEGDPAETEIEIQDGAVGEQESGAESEAEPASAPETEPAAEPTSETEAEPAPETGPAPEPDPEQEPDAVEPAVSTYDWTPTGADCEACGTAVERRWRDDGRLVCAECKTW